MTKTRYYFIHGKEEGNIPIDYPLGCCLPTPDYIHAVCMEQKFTHAFLAYIPLEDGVIQSHKNYTVVVTQELMRGEVVQLLNKVIKARIN